MVRTGANRLAAFTAAALVALGTAFTASDAEAGPKDRASERAQECLAIALYHEARGEPVAGQDAVGRVIMNRVDSKYHPDTVCGVVYKNAHKRNRCQFSFACDGISDRPKEKGAWEKQWELAGEILDCDLECREETREKGGIESATHYHATYVSPGWARKLEKKGKVGRHIFYYTATI